MNTRFSINDYFSKSGHCAHSSLLCRSVVRDILDLYALPDSCDIVSLKGCLRNLDIPDEAVVNLDSLSTILASALDVVNVNVVNQFTKQRSGYHLHFHELMHSENKLRLTSLYAAEIIECLPCCVYLLFQLQKFLSCLCYRSKILSWTQVN